MEEHSPAREPAHTAGAATRERAATTVQCDVCLSPMVLPQHCIEQGTVLGLLTCSLCIEDQLQAQTEDRL